MSSSTNSLSYRLDENVSFANESEQFKLQLVELVRRHAIATNARDVGAYESVELINGQTYFGVFGAIDAQKKVQVFRKCFAFGAIAAGATLNIAHGITHTQLTRLYGTCVTATNSYRPIPRVSATAVTEQIQLDVVDPNIVIVNGATAPAITSGLIVLEYMRN